MKENKHQNAPIIISLGGSLIYPSTGIDINFLEKFRKFILDQVSQGKRFFIICGGGTITRQYQKIASEVVSNTPDEDLDWLGTHATRLNAQLLRTVLSDVAYKEIIYNYGKKIDGFDRPAVIAAGWKPGWSTDYCATLLARDHNASTIINLSNIEAVYDKDPKTYRDAKPLKQITWENFEKLVGSKWTPGANLPFDPVATKLSKSLGLTIFIVKGGDLDNVKKALQGQPFKGTIVLPARHDTSFYNREYFELGIGYSGYTTTKKGRLLSHLSNLYRALTIKIFLNPKTVLDVGCATGLLVYYLRKMGIEAYGIEVSKYALSKAHPSIKDYLQYGNIYKLPFNDKSFDVVTTFEVLEHLEINEIKEALSECCRVKKRVVIHKIYTTENKWITSTRGDDFSRVNIHPSSWWKDFLNSLGYSQVKVFFPKLPKYMETIFLLDKKTK